MTDLDRALKDALVLGLENDATAEHILRIAAPFIDRAFRDQNNRIEKLEAALLWYAEHCQKGGDDIEGPYGDYGQRARKALNTSSERVKNNGES